MRARRPSFQQNPKVNLVQLVLTPKGCQNELN